MLKVFDNKIFVCGIDEAGRGCLAGPVTAAAVVLPKKYKNPFIKDSKKLNKSNRLDLFNEIIECSLDYAIIDISPKIIDSINILESTFLAMNNAISKIHSIIDYTIIDGNKFKTEKRINHKGKRFTKTLKQINLINYLKFNRSTSETPLILIYLLLYNL